MVSTPLKKRATPKTAASPVATKKTAKAEVAPAAPSASLLLAPDVDAVSKVKSKLVRDSFTIPKIEYQVLEALKLRAANLKRPTKKSELLRAGISVLNTLGDAKFLAALAGVPSLRTGRPKRND